MLLDLTTQDGLTPTRKGADEFCSPCPACGGRDRFIVHPDAGRYWCRGCGIKGDAIGYLRRFRGMSFHQAAEVAGLPSSSRPGQSGPTRPPETRRPAPTSPPEAWTAQAEKMIVEANAALLADPAQMDWLRTKRGLTRETAKRFRLGWIERNLYRDRAKWGLPPELRDDGNLKKLLLPTGLLIPGPDRLRIRRRDPGEYGKYFVIPGSGNAPLIIGADHPAETTGSIIVESELDAILLAQELAARPLLIVATGSTSNGPGPELLADLTRRPFVMVALDNDEGGGKAAWGKWMWLPNAARAPILATWGKDHTHAFLAGHDLRQWFAIALCLAGHQVPQIAPAAGGPLEQETEQACTAIEPEQAVEPAPEPAVIGLPCGGCGSTHYTRVADGYAFPDGSRANGWHCDGPTCGVKLLTGNEEVDRLHKEERPVVIRL